MSAPVDSVARAVTLAEKEEQTRARQRDDGTDAVNVAEKAYLDTGSDADLDTVQRSRLKSERATALHVKATEALAVARERQRLADLERTRVQVAEDKIALARFDDSLSLLVASLVDLDQRADQTLLQLARSVRAGQEAHDAATGRARMVGAMIETPRPTFGDVKLSIARTLTKLRAEEGREDVSELFATVANNWTTAGLSADELATHRARKAQNERSALVSQGARLALALVPAPVAPATPDGAP